PVPAILEYLPYRRSDHLAHRDSLRHPYFAGHGYASVRVDMRGTGDSDGILLDEYLVEEQDDALEVLAWLAAQPWCTGRVGLFGKSWGGFNGLQIAARRPSELGAVISLYSTDDRYADDVHYMGGCLLAADALPWASTMLSLNALPPDPAVVGERWRELWLDRLERTPPYIEAWVAHQRRDAYWRHASVCEDYAAIECPVYAIGGWADAYTNAVLRLLEGLPGPCKGLIGPWGHSFPDEARPGPEIGFLQECLRFWDQHLKGIDTGVMDEPMLRAWMQDAVEPRSSHRERPGRWVADPSWPSPHVTTRCYSLNDGTLDAEAGPAGRLLVRGVQSAGSDAGLWCAWGVLDAPDLPPDQRREDGLSLTFTSCPLAEPLEILGFPEVRLAVQSDRPLALVAVRLCAVAPDGASLLVSRGLLNLAHRDGHEEPAPLEPGRTYTVTVRLNAIGQVVPVGHRLRVGVSPTYWPHAWPSPETVTLAVLTGRASRLDLPVRTPQPADAELEPFAAAEVAQPIEVEPWGDHLVARVVERDRGPAGDGVRVVIDKAESGRLVASDLSQSERSVFTYAVVEDDPLAASVRCDWTLALGRGDWQVRVETTSLMTADAEAFRITSSVDAYEGDTRVHATSRSVAIPRDHV
ncbi:MAG: CocE/NonD family hydrolase, partial [Solirubrobacterales bacterium]|nr:CocE/NonD family hydrolase [Solirubrobacterales bacterium]